MKQSVLNLAVLSALGFISSQAMATGFVSLPVTGFALSGGATTPYVRCNVTGNYGSDASTPPTTAANNTCAVFSGDSVISTLIASTLGATITYSGVAVATIDQAVWSNGLTGGSQACIYNLRLSMLDNPYNGSDTLNINGIALSGFGSFTAANSVQAAYYYSSPDDEVVFRIGRTYTSVQHRAALTGPSVVALGYADHPTTASSTPSNAITGVSTYSTVSLAVPTQAQQSAAVAPNWVEFTTDVNYDDADGTTYANSSQLYVKVTGTGACPSGTSQTANAYSLRQTGQETTPWVEFKIPGYIPAAGNTTVPSP
jgi:hypothetical protein